MNKYLKKYHKELLFLLLLVTFFSFSVIITYDSSHYMSYVNILKGNLAFSTWDIVRGPIFPFLIFGGIFLFGETIQGLLILFFLFYLLYAYLVYAFATKILQNRSVRWIVIFFCLLNPMIFGYFHTLLTEFVAITFAMLSCYLACLWWNEKDVNKRNACSLFFIFGMAFAWLLKQPYICCAFFPMVISAIFAIIKNHTWKNIRYYIGVCVLSLFFMIVAIFSWNQILIYHDVDMNTGRDSSSMLSSQLMLGVQYFEYDSNFDFNSYDSNSFLSTNEKNYIRNHLNENQDNLKIIKIYNHNKLVDLDVIPVDKNGNLSTTSVILQIVKTFFKHPTIIIKNYLKNYCALSSVCSISSSDGVSYRVTNQMELIDTYEHQLIAYRTFDDTVSNRFPLSEDGYSFTNNLAQQNQLGIFALFFQSLEKPTNIIFKLTILLLPIALLTLIIFRIIKRKKMQKYSLYVMSFILLSYSFLTVLANAVSGSIIDRYAINSFIPGLFGIITSIVWIIKNVKLKKHK